VQTFPELMLLLGLFDKQLSSLAVKIEVIKVHIALSDQCDIVE